jgi:hypothetical protein
MTRESEAVTHLRADEDPAALVTGGIYAFSVLGVEGITDPLVMPDVWSGGFQPTIIVRLRTPVPAFGLIDLKDQAASNSQVLEIWAYALTAAEIYPILDAVYGSLQGYRFENAWRAEWVGGIDVMDAPELPPGTKLARIDFRIVAIRRPVAA